MLGVVFERLTETARQVVVQAQAEARALCHNYVGTEHELLGLLFDEDEIAGRVLNSFGITARDVRERVLEIVGRGEEPMRGGIPFTPRAKKVLVLAGEESLRLGHGHIGTEHLLLGLLGESGGVEMRILQDSGVSVNHIREAVITAGPHP